MEWSPLTVPSGNREGGRRDLFALSMPLHPLGTAHLFPPFCPLSPPLTPSQKVHSFDLVASAPGVVACNMAAVPLDDASVGAAVFSLALMGTDYGAFLLEAKRVSDEGGGCCWLWMCEGGVPRLLLCTELD